MSDITISVTQPPSTTINVGVDETTLIQAGISFPTHSVTHISGGSDELNHNLLAGLQGGSDSQYYHLSSGEYFNLVTGQVIRPDQTGLFYANSNPSGFITGVNLSSYATITYVTGISGQLQAQITVLSNQTGQFYLNSNPSGFITGVDLSSYTSINYVSGVSGNLQSQITNLNNSTGSYVLDSETGNFITTSETGKFYPASNPSGFITGVDLSSYVLNTETGQFYSSSNPSGYTVIGYVTGISGGLQTQIITLNNQTGSYYPRTNPSGYITGVDLSFSGNYYTKTESESRYVNTTGAETILGNKTFHDNVYINNLYVTGLETIVNTTNTNVASNYIMLNLTGGAVDGGVFFVTGSGLTGINDSGAIIGFDHSDKFKFGISTRASDLSTLSTIASVEQMTEISGGLQTQITTLNNQTGGYVLKTETGNFITNSQTGQFYPNSNPSGFITGIDLSSYATQVYVTGISGDLQTQISDLNNSTGQFYLNSNPSGYITGIDLSAYATIDYTTGISGELQTQITDLSNATGSYVLSSQTGDFYPNSNPSGFITGVDNTITTSTATNLTGFIYGDGTSISAKADAPSDGKKYVRRNTQWVALQIDVPFNTAVPTISGTTQVGETLTATNGTWEYTPIISYRYQWQVSTTGTGDWQDIATETANTLILTSGLGNFFVRVTVWATNAFGESSPAYSSASTQITPALGLLSGLTAYWKLDETTGTRIDSIGGYDLTENNSVGYSAGIINNAASFSSGSWLTADPLALTGRSVSVSYWVKTPTMVGGFGGYSLPINSNNIIGGFIAAAGGAHPAGCVAFDVLYDGAYQRVQGATPVDDDMWNHVLVVCDGLTLKLYINGVLDGDIDISSVSGSFQPNNDLTSINGTPDGSFGSATIKFDEIAVWNRALSTSEIASIYNSGNGFPYEGMSLPNGLKGFWSLDNTLDSSGNSLTLTNNNGVTFAAGKIGDGAVFDGTNTLSASPNTNLSDGGVTVSYWVKTPLNAGIQVSVGFFVGANAVYCGWLPDGNVFADLAHGVEGYSNVPNGSLSDDAWTHVVMRADSLAETWTAVVNGVFTVRTLPAPVNTIDNLGTIYIGANRDGTSEPMIGMLDAVGIWNRPLSDTEILVLYNAGAGYEV